jgi:outer membrane protein OmpA-like peptidoglycan-associated protein
MNAFKFGSSLALAIAVSFAVTGCKHKVPPITRFPNGGMNGNSGDNLDNGAKIGNGTGADTMGGGPTANFNPDDMAQDRSAFAADTVYFDYDSSTIKGSEQSKLTAIASALQADASAKLLVEGYCDERGTEEYNRSLGERRALASREALANAGISADRVATRSYGEDRAADPGHTPAAWSKNRRDEFVLLHPK